MLFDEDNDSEDNKKNDRSLKDEAVALIFEINNLLIMSNLSSDNTKEKNLGAVVDRIIENAKNIDDTQTNIILAIKNHLIKKDKTPDEQEKAAEIEKQITEDISGFINRVYKSKAMSKNIDKTTNNNAVAGELNAVSKSYLKGVMKRFVVYEIYKVMNPKRIAGETKKQNYQKNVKQIGVEKARKYEGGSKSDLKQYGVAEVKRMDAQSGIGVLKKTLGLAR